MRHGWLLFIGVAMMIPPSASAQENELYIRQETLPAAATGNRLTVDQSLASDSVVRGLSIDVGTDDLQPFQGLTVTLEDFALQRGDGNEAEIAVEGDGGAVRLLQDNSASTAAVLTGNLAEISALGGGTAIVGQSGDGNRAFVNLDTPLAGGAVSTGSNGTVVQVGDSNEGTVNVTGGASGVLVQIGDGNEYQLDAAGGAVTLTQIGNGLTGTVPAQVISNGASVQITQSQFQGAN